MDEWMDGKPLCHRQSSRWSSSLSSSVIIIDIVSPYRFHRRSSSLSSSVMISCHHYHHLRHRPFFEKHLQDVKLDGVLMTSASCEWASGNGCRGGKRSDGNNRVFVRVISLNCENYQSLKSTLQDNRDLQFSIPNASRGL